MKKALEKTEFRVPAEFQMRFRKIEGQELSMFRAYSVRPSPTSSARMEVESYIRNLDAKDTVRTLVERAFYILLNIDQRLERLEETVLNHVTGKSQDHTIYDWVSGSIGSSCMSFITEADADPLAVGDILLLDFLLPDLPEQRIVATGKVRERDSQEHWIVDFDAIHPDDGELIHRFLMLRQREILRERAASKKLDE